MTNENFNIEVEKSYLRSKQLLIKKGEEYSSNFDRLDQFHRAGHAQNIPPTQALVGMFIKHVTSLSDMSKDPLSYNIKKWREKITDVRNYTFLLDALLKDLGVE
jgi:hypothetical protein